MPTYPHRTRRSTAVLLALGAALAMILLRPPPATAQSPPLDAPNLANTCFRVPGAEFPDVSGSHAAVVHGTAIDCFAAYELTEGTRDGKFQPEAGVRRWHMALFLARLTTRAADDVDELHLPSEPEAPFDDIDDVSPPAQDAIALLAELGVTQGVSSNRFAPQRLVTRGQMATFIDRLQGVIQTALGGDPNGFSSTEDFFADDDGTTHEQQINDIAAVGITKGQQTTAGPMTFAPNRSVLRAEMASFLIRHLGVNVDTGAIESTFPLDANAESAESTGQRFLAAVDEGDLEAAAEWGTPRAIAVAEAVTGMIAVDDREFIPWSELPGGPDEWGGDELSGYMIVPLRPPDEDRGLECHIEAGFVRACYDLPGT